MTKEKVIIILIAIIFIVIVFLGLNSIFNPPKADFDDFIFEDIGGDEFLNVTIKYSLKTHEENIPNGIFNTSAGQINYYDAKKITYVGLYGVEDYFIVWKTTPDKYDWIKNQSVNQYISTFLVGDVKGKCFVEYSYENNHVYGVMLSTDKNNISESKFLYEILGLNPYGFELSYAPSYPSYGGDYSVSSGGYHTTVPDRYTLSRTDPGAYYDHYEYGDNYDIDDYLESEGFD